MFTTELHEVSFRHSLQFVLFNQNPGYSKDFLWFFVRYDKYFVSEHDWRFFLPFCWSWWARSRTNARNLRLRLTLKAINLFFYLVFLESGPERINFWFEFQLADIGPFCPSCLENVWTVRRCDSAETGANDIVVTQRHLILDWMFFTYFIEQVFLETIGVVKVVLKLSRQHLLISH